MKKIYCIAIALITLSLTGCWEADEHLHGQWIEPMTGRFTFSGIMCELNIGQDNPGMSCINTNDVSVSVQIRSQGNEFSLLERNEMPLLAGETYGNAQARVSQGDIICVSAWRYKNYIDYLINQTAPDAYACYTVTEGDMPLVGDERITLPYDIVLPVLFGAECHFTGHYDPKTWEQYDRIASCTKNQYSVDVRFPKYNNMGMEKAPIYSISYFLTEQPFEIGIGEARDEATYSESVTSTSVYGIEVCRYSITGAVIHWQASQYYVCAARAYTLNLDLQTFDLVQGRVEGYSNDNTAPIE